jgi:hypothetical protein
MEKLGASGRLDDADSALTRLRRELERLAQALSTGSEG